MSPHPLKRLRRALATRLADRFPSLVDRWLERHPVARSADVPWTPFRGELSRARVGLVTTGGVHLAGQPPFDAEDDDGDPSWRELPARPAPPGFRITHPWYDTRPARADLNLVFPLERLAELAAAGRIGSPVARHAGLMGHVDGRHLATLQRETAPAVARLFRDQRADIVLLVPA